MARAAQALRVGVLASGAGTNLGGAARRARPRGERRGGRRRPAERDRAAARRERRHRDRRLPAGRPSRPRGAGRGDRRLAARARRRARRARRLHGAADEPVPGALSRRRARLPPLPAAGVSRRAGDRDGVKVFGVTVHFVEDDGGVDTGPVLLQAQSSCPTPTTRRPSTRSCARSSTHCCPRRCGSSPRARSRAIRYAAPGRRTTRLTLERSRRG